MNLPNAESADLPLPKMRDYLLDLEHPEGGGKAVFFLARGFHPDRWQLLADAFRAMILCTPITRSVRVRSVWIIEPGESVPRFVTAYPIRFT